jgi:transcriptional regulator with GAF, ATPase, and Fis domain
MINANRSSAVCQLNLRHIDQLIRRNKPLACQWFIPSNYNWPSNVRELENIVERAAIQYRGAKQKGVLNFEIPNPSFMDPENEETQPPKKDVSSFEDETRATILKAMALSKGKVEGPDGAAQRLKLHPSTLRAKMRKLGIPHSRGN